MLRAAVTAGFLTIAGLAIADDTLPAGVGAPAGKASAMAEEKLLSKIHHVNEMEIKAGNLAKEKAQSDDVKKFGETLVKDHTKADEKVSELAKKHGITLGNPTSEDPKEQSEMKEHMEAMKKLESLSGADFDRQFLTLMQDGHDKTYRMLDEQRGLQTDKDVQTLIGEIAPTVKQHLETATRLLDESDRKK